MTSLFTQCPHCQTSFRVSNAQLSAAHGLVRCGSCLGVFSASANEIRIKHPDGYIVEELEDDQDQREEQQEEQQQEEQAAQEFTDSLDSVGETEVIEEVTHESPIVTPAVVAAPPDPVDVESTKTSNVRPKIDYEAAELWHNRDEPHFTLGDLRLDELEDEYEEEQESGSAMATQAIRQTGEEAADLDEPPIATFTEEHDEVKGEECGEYSAEYDEEIEESFEDAYDEKPAIASPAIPGFGDEKHAIRAKLDTLRYDDALAPLSDDELYAFDDEPLTLVHRSNFRGGLATALLLASNLLLLLALPLPWLYTHRNELATHPRFSFMAAPVCRYFACTAATKAATVPTTLYTQQLLVRSHPTAPDALEVVFVFHNDADAPQSFPKLALAFSDIDNHLLANRLFSPDEYLPPELRVIKQMPAKSSVQIQLELVDPGKEAVNYKVELYPL